MGFGVAQGNPLLVFDFQLANIEGLFV